MAKVTTKIDKVQQKLEETTSQLKRALADYHNLERRISEEKQSLGKFAVSIIVLKFLPVLDNLKKAGKHINDNGLDLVIKQFEEVLVSEGVMEIQALNQTFNPQIHEAVEVVQGEEDNKVTKVIETGYLLDSKILRPAKVVVVKKELNDSKTQQSKQDSQTSDYV